jgi:hypothetical protein
MGPSSPMQSTPRSRATLGSTSDWKISFNPVVKRWGIQEIQRIQKILFSNLKITNFEWNLVFQPPKIAGSMLIYINLLEGILYTVILNISWNWQWRKELADDLLWPLILSIVAVGSRLMEHLGGSIQTQTCHLFFFLKLGYPKNQWLITADHHFPRNGRLARKKHMFGQTAHLILIYSFCNIF